MEERRAVAAAVALAQDSHEWPGAVGAGEGGEAGEQGGVPRLLVLGSKSEDSKEARRK